MPVDARPASVSVTAQRPVVTSLAPPYFVVIAGQAGAAGLDRLGALVLLAGASTPGFTPIPVFLVALVLARDLVLALKFRARLEAGQGLVSNNVLHTRTRFTDGEIPRLLYRARYYDQATGQFISADPIGFEIDFYRRTRDEIRGALPSILDRITQDRAAGKFRATVRRIEVRVATSAAVPPGCPVTSSRLKSSTTDWSSGLTKAPRARVPVGRALIAPLILGPWHRAVIISMRSSPGRSRLGICRSSVT